MLANLLNSKNIFFAIFSFIISNTCYALSDNLSRNDLSNTLMKKQNEKPEYFSDFEKQIAAKLALDIRYFCQKGTGSDKRNCLKPVTELPQALASMITETGIGSVVLFAENLESNEQVIKLTDALQQAAVKSYSKQPLIISIDQEGGRVVRLPQATSFAGNMAIGSTYQAKGTHYATEVSTVIAKELKLLGFNNNYAPVVDVNTNAKNPVINTRSFGENPQRVAELGAAAVNAFQKQDIMATLKHFPGHGDTHVDSHLGLPVVEHDLATIEKNDIAPFQWAIEHSNPAMIMTAHIQYPALDNSTIKNVRGDEIIRPATMSRKVLTDLLRKRMGFEGIIATDALDMAGIAHYFDEVTAVVETFIAGADLAVMPFKIRAEEDVEKFYLFIKAVAAAMQDRMKVQDSLLSEISQSISRITSYKENYINLPKQSIYERIAEANKKIAQAESLLLEQALANDSAVLLSNNKSSVPVSMNNISRIHLLVLNWQEFGALKQAINSLWQHSGRPVPQVSATVVAEKDAYAQIQSGVKLSQADLLIATIDTKIASVVDIGGAEDLLTGAIAKNNHSRVSYEQLLTQQLQLAKEKNVTSALIVKGSPFLIAPFKNLVNNIVVTFDDRIYQQENKEAHSPGYQTATSIIFGNQASLGNLPVRLQVD